MTNAIHCTRTLTPESRVELATEVAKMGLLAADISSRLMSESADPLYSRRIGALAAMVWHLREVPSSETINRSQVAEINAGLMERIGSPTMEFPALMDPDPSLKPRLSNALVEFASACTLLKLAATPVGDPDDASPSILISQGLPKAAKDYESSLRAIQRVECLPEKALDDHAIATRFAVRYLGSAVA